MAKVIGIDLGTSNSAAAAVENGKLNIIPSAGEFAHCHWRSTVFAGPNRGREILMKMVTAYVRPSAPRS